MHNACAVWAPLVVFEATTASELKSFGELRVRAYEEKTADGPESRRCYAAVRPSVHLRGSAAPSAVCRSALRTGCWFAAAAAVTAPALRGRPRSRARASSSGPRLSARSPGTDRARGAARVTSTCAVFHRAVAEADPLRPK